MEFKEEPIGGRLCQRSFACSEQTPLSISMKNPWSGRNSVVLQLRSQVVKPVGKFDRNFRYPSMRWKLPIHLLAVLALVFSSIRASPAQTSTSGGVSGVVSDPSHAVVPNTVVELRDETKGTIQTTKTDRDGVYQFFLLAPGKYTLSVSHAGFREENDAVNILLGPPGTRNITLEIAGGSATVNVTGEMPLLQAEDSDVSTTMNLTQISQVPNPGNDLQH